MSLFTKNELKLFEELFNLKSGHILKMSRDKFAKFIYDSIDIDITSKDYENKVKKHKKSISRPQIYRYIVECEDKSKSLKFLNDLIEYMEKGDFDYSPDKLAKAKRILKNKSNLKYDLKPYENAEKQVIETVEHINETIDNGKPYFALSDLHTYMTNYIRFLCGKHNIEFEEKEDLDKVFKRYVKYLENYIDTDMSKSILKQSISLFSEFNNVRNNYTLAHDRNLLSEAESLLIFRYVESLFEYIRTIENNYSHDL